MNVELIDHRLNGLEKGLEATNENIQTFAEVARLHGETIANIKAKSEALHQSVKDLAHTQKNTEIGIDILMKKSDERLAAIEKEQLRREGARSVWNFLITKFPAIGSVILFLLIIIMSIDLDKLIKLIGK
jgi:hypothetical protein